ncbi:unnamed protein product [Effrenium voratum]|nr:unnamed protein product [Effrenium voratum]
MEPAICEPGGRGLIFPLTTEEVKWEGWVRATIYMVAMLYIFLGVNIAADKFVEAIEGITSTKRRVLQRSTGRVITVSVWNGTVANLTLLALGSSAPEILLSVVEIIGNGCFAGELGPATIVGPGFCRSETLAKLCNRRPALGEWSVDQVCDFLAPWLFQGFGRETLGLDEELQQRFRKESISGRVLTATPWTGSATGAWSPPLGAWCGGSRRSARRRAGLLAVPGRLVGVPHHWQGLGPERRGLHHGGGPLPRAPLLLGQGEAASICGGEKQARKYDAERKASMDHSGTSFERNYEVYPVVEPPPLCNLPLQTGSSTADAAQLQKLRAEVSGLKSRSTAVQRQMFEGLGAGQDQEDVGRALEQLKKEPTDDVELAQKFGVYESYFSGVVELRTDLFGLWERGRAVLSAADARTMHAALGRVDSFDNLSIPERSRFWFVYHMMSTASSNHQKMQKIFEDLEEPL